MNESKCYLCNGDFETNYARFVQECIRAIREDIPMCDKCQELAKQPNPNLKMVQVQTRTEGDK